MESSSQQKKSSRRRRKGAVVVVPTTTSTALPSLVVNEPGRKPTNWLTGCWVGLVSIIPALEFPSPLSLTFSRTLSLPIGRQTNGDTTGSFGDLFSTIVFPPCHSG